MAGPVLFSVTPIVAPAGDTIVSVDSINNVGQVAGVAMDGSGNLFPYVMTGGSSVAVPFPAIAVFSPASVYQQLGPACGYRGNLVASFYFRRVFWDGCRCFPRPWFSKRRG